MEVLHDAEASGILGGWAVRVRERTSRSIEGVEAPRSQGARRAHTRRYVTDEQHRERGWIDARSD
jgi:hypothetical protein